MAKIADLFVDLHLDTSAFTRELNTALARASSRDVKVNVDTRSATKNVQVLNKNINKSADGINTYTGRISVLADAILALGPAAIGASAVAIPAVAALGTGFVELGVAAGTVKVAFIGVGNALSTMSKAHLEPTTANLQAMRTALGNLSPEAAHFTRFIFSMRGELDNLKAAAGTDLFPGLEKGLSAASSRLPQVNTLLKDFGGVLGDIAQKTGEALGTDNWNVLFTFLDRNARPILIDVADAAVHVAHGFIEIADAFAPLSRGGFDWMDQVSRQFDSWAIGVRKTQGFKDFVAYVKENGPLLVDALVAVSKAIIAIAKAAAPLSGPVLQSITGIANVLAKIAGSDIGPPLFAAAIAMRTFSRASQLLAPATRGASTAFTGLSTAILDFRTSGNALAGVAGGGKLAALGRGLAGFGEAAKAAAGPAGILAIADSATRTQGPLRSLEAAAGGAALGFSVGGPWGAAIGGGLGLLTSFIGGTKEAVVSLDDLTASLNQNTGALTEQSNAVIASALGKAGVAENAKTLGISLQTVTDAAIKGGPALDALNKSLDAQIEAGKSVVSTGKGAAVIYTAQARAAQDLKNTLGDTNSTINDALSKGKVQAAVNNSVARATKQLADGEITAAQAARQQAAAERAAVSALNAKHDATLAAFDATTAYGQALADARAQAAKSTKGLDANTEAGRANRTALSGLAASWNNLGEKAQAIPGAYAKARHSFVQVASDMGVPIERARTLADRLLDVGRIKVDPQVGLNDASFQKTAHNVTAAMARANALHANPDITVSDAQALKAARDVAAALAALRNKTIQITTVHVTGGRSVLGAGSAEGGFIRGPGTPTSDSIPVRLSDGEFVMRAAAVRRYGVNTMARMNALRLAEGGPVTLTPAQTAAREKAKEAAAAAREARQRRAENIRSVLNSFVKELRGQFDATQMSHQLTRFVKHHLSGADQKEFTKRLDRLAKLGERQQQLTKDIEKARQILQNKQQAKQQFVQSFREAQGFNISEFAQTPGGVLGGARAKLAALKRFGHQLRQLSKIYPRGLVMQIADLGLEGDGPAAAAQLLSLPPQKQRELSNVFGQLNAQAKKQAKQFGSRFFDAGIEAAQGILKGLTDHKRELNEHMRQLGGQIAIGLAQELNVSLHPKKHHHKATHDEGGWLEVGRNLTVNNTGRPEAVLNQRQWQNMERLVAVLERQTQIGGHGDSRYATAPFIGHAVIRETVDLERYERQRAFRQRMTRAGG